MPLGVVLGLAYECPIPIRNWRHPLLVAAPIWVWAALILVLVGLGFGLVSCCDMGFAWSNKVLRFQETLQ